MKFKSALAPLFVFLLAAVFVSEGSVAFAKEKAREETLMIFGQRRVLLNVPEGFIFSSEKDERGLITARLSDTKEKVSLSISFLPDNDEQGATPRSRKEFMVQTFQQYVSGSVEKAMQFEELDPRTGAGTYCVFTDSTLVGQTKFASGEYLNSTAGVKAWRGCLAVFTVFSNDTKSEEYLTTMKFLRESVMEKPLLGPLKAEP